MSEGIKKHLREAAARERRILAELDREQRRRDVADQPTSGSESSRSRVEEGGGDRRGPWLRGAGLGPPVSSRAETPSLAGAPWLFMRSAEVLLHHP
jgi:hypothetical protein